MFPICQFYINRQCTNPDCIYRHPTTEKETLFCVDYARGFCAQGPKCSQKHDKFTADERRHIGDNVIRAVESHKRMQRRRPGTVDENDNDVKKRRDETERRPRRGRQ